MGEEEMESPGAGAGEQDAVGEEGQDIELLLEDTRARADEHYDQLLRAQAELENLRRRTRIDLENAHKFALEKFVGEMLAVSDSMELGLSAARETDDVASLREGLELTLKMLADVFGRFNVEAVDPAGEKFNPELHQAMSMQASGEAEPGTVLHVVQKGYLLNERLIRPAMVIVAQAAQPAAADDSGEA